MLMDAWHAWLFGGDCARSQAAMNTFTAAFHEPLYRPLANEKALLVDKWTRYTEDVVSPLLIECLGAKRRRMCVGMAFLTWAWTCGRDRAVKMNAKRSIAVRCKLGIRYAISAGMLL